MHSRWHHSWFLLMVAEMGIALIADAFQVPLIGWLISFSLLLAYVTSTTISHILSRHATTAD